MVKTLSQVFNDKTTSDWPTNQVPFFTQYLFFENLSKVVEQAVDQAEGESTEEVAPEGESVETTGNQNQTQPAGDDQAEGEVEQTPENLEANDQTGKNIFFKFFLKIVILRDRRFGHRRPGRRWYRY